MVKENVLYLQFATKIIQKYFSETSKLFTKDEKERLQFLPPDQYNRDMFIENDAKILSKLMNYYQSYLYSTYSKMNSSLKRFSSELEKLNPEFLTALSLTLQKELYTKDLDFLRKENKSTDIELSNSKRPSSFKYRDILFYKKTHIDHLRMIKYKNGEYRSYQSGSILSTQKTKSPFKY